MPNKLLVLTPQMCHARRKDLELTEAKVATRVHICPETYSRWERGRQKPSGKHLVLLAKVLGFIDSESGAELVIEWRKDTDGTEGQLAAQETGPAGTDGPAGVHQARVPIPDGTSRNAAHQPAVIAQPVVYLLNNEALNRTVTAIVQEKLGSFLAGRETKE